MPAVFNGKASSSYQGTVVLLAHEKKEHNIIVIVRADYPYLNNVVSDCPSDSKR